MVRTCLEETQRHDPRTIARDVAGVFETVFPQMFPGVCAYLNRERSFSVSDCTPVSSSALRTSALQPAMLFELAVALTEQRILGDGPINWEAGLQTACQRQRRYFDAKIPESLTPADRDLALLVSDNLAKMLERVSQARHEPLLVRPDVPGYAWIASGKGDFGTRSCIVEVKCTRRRFSMADYRQVIFYWLLSYVNAFEKDVPTWASGVLLNPRLNFGVQFEFDELLALISDRRSLIAAVERFRFIIGDNADLPSIEPQTR